MATATVNGRISQVIGSTFDAEFDEGHMPNIYNALKIEGEVNGVKINLAGEVQQHLGGNRVRCVALGSTDGVVRGIGGYGNSLGLPNIGGETVFDACYAGNPLVNALCVGVLRQEDLHLAFASGAGNKIILIGART